MYWKVMKNGEIIDVLDHLTYLKHQVKHDLVLQATRKDAQLFLSSDGQYVWHSFSLRRLPSDVIKYDTVKLVEISEIEYDSIKHLSLKNKK